MASSFRPYLGQFLFYMLCLAVSIGGFFFLARYPLDPLDLPEKNYRIAFASEFKEGDETNEDICVVHSDGAGFRRLTDTSGDDTMPAFSPDGSRIAFVSERDGNKEIYVMHADGSNQRRLTDFVGDDSQPCWSSGDEIIFVRMLTEPGTESQTDLFGLTVSTGALQQLAKTPTNESFPDVARSGGYLLFTGVKDVRYIRGKRVEEQRLYTATVSGKFPEEVPVLEKKTVQNVFRNPTFSPDGRAIVYQWFRSYGSHGDESLWWLNFSTHSSIALLDSPYVREIAFSPDGQQLVLTHGNPPRLYELDVSDKALGEMARSDPRENMKCLVPLPIDRVTRHPSCAPLPRN